MGSPIGRGARAVVTEFFAMGGYGGYVWTSYGITLLVLGVLPYLASVRLKRALADLAANRGISESEVHLTVTIIE